MIIYLDFDGTVVEHDYPRVGIVNKGVFEVISQLQERGHEIVINTYRAQLEGEKGMEKIIQLVNSMAKKHNKKSDYLVYPIEKIKSEKIHPIEWFENLKNSKERGYLFLDDQSRNSPLKRSRMVTNTMVDWDLVQEDLRSANII